jgi:hypothetical protein
LSEGEECTRLNVLAVLDGIAVDDSLTFYGI